MQNIRESISNSEYIEKDDRVIVCRHEPYIMTYSKSERKTVVIIPVWEKTSYEYEEYDVKGITFIVEEIEVQ